MPHHVPIIMPQLGESIAEATVVNMLIKVGDTVAADQDIIEVETNKATMNVSSPCAGRVEKLLVKLNESYAVGATLGFLEVTKEVADRLGIVKADGATETNGKDTELIERTVEARKNVEPTVHGLPVPAHAA